VDDPLEPAGSWSADAGDSGPLLRARDLEGITEQSATTVVVL